MCANRGENRLIQRDGEHQDAGGQRPLLLPAGEEKRGEAARGAGDAEDGRGQPERDRAAARGANWTTTSRARSAAVKTFT